MANSRGMTLAEVLVAVALFWVLMALAVPGLRSFFFRMEFRAAVRGVTAGLSAARYQAIRDGRPVRVEVAGGRLLLSRDDGLGWRVFRSIDLGQKVVVSANGRPVFSPLGSVSPLCTITLAREKRTCRVVLSMYGRLKVYDNG